MLPFMHSRASPGEGLPHVEYSGDDGCLLVLGVPHRLPLLSLLLLGLQLRASNRLASMLLGGGSCM